MDGGCMPLPTRPHRYCDSASLVKDAHSNLEKKSWWIVNRDNEIPRDKIYVDGQSFDRKRVKFVLLFLEWRDLLLGHFSFTIRHHAPLLMKRARF